MHHQSYTIKTNSEAAHDLMKQEWLLKRNCSLSPRQAALAYGLLCSGVMIISLAFAWAGLWFVFGFGLIEVGAVGVALLYYARHANDQEHIALSDDRLLIERTEAGMLRRTVLDPSWTRIAPPGRRKLITLESRGVKVEVGAFVSEDIRRCVATELRQQLKRTSCLA